MQHGVHGILVRKVDVGDDDLVVTFLTPLGLLTFFARAARRSRKRFSGQLDFFRILHLESRQTRESSWRQLTACELIEVWTDLWLQPAKLPIASRFIELGRALATEENAAALYPYLTNSLRYLASPSSTSSPASLQELAVRFELRLSMELGFGPNVTRACRRCLLDDDQALLFHPEWGGGVCEPCADRDRRYVSERLRLPPPVVAWLSHYQTAYRAPRALESPELSLLNQVLVSQWRHLGVG